MNVDKFFKLGQEYAQNLAKVEAEASTAKQEWEKASALARAFGEAKVTEWMGHTLDWFDNQDWFSAMRLYEAQRADLLMAQSFVYMASPSDLADVQAREAFELRAAGALANAWQAFWRGIASVNG